MNVLRVRNRTAPLAAGALALAVLLGLTLAASGVRAQSGDGQLTLSAEGNGVTCSGDACTVPPGGSFTLVVSVTQAPNEGYIGIGTQVRFANLTYSPTDNQNDEIVVSSDGFPGIAVRAPGRPGLAEHGMTAGTPPNFTTSHYTGPVLNLAMTCTSTYSRNDIELAAYSEANSLGSGFKLPVAADGRVAATSDALTVRCGEVPAGGEPTNTPTGPGGNNGTPATPDLSSPEGQATATAIARATGTAVAGVTATAEANEDGGSDNDDDGGSSNTGLWIALGSVGGAAVVLGGGYYGWRRYRQRSEA